MPFFSAAFGQTAPIPAAKIGLAGLFLAIVVPLSGVSFLREPLAVLSPMDRSRTELEMALSQPAQPQWAEEHLQSLAYRDPLQSAALVTLGIVRMRADRQQAQAVAPLMNEALKRQPSFEQPRIWMAAFYAMRGDDQAAMREFDDVLSRSNGLIQPVLPVLGYLLTNPKSRAGMIERMQRFPPWRTAALLAAIQHGSLTAGEIAKLLAGPAPKRSAETLDIERSTYLAQLVAQAKADQAYALFRGYAGVHGGSPINDGAFQIAKPIRPFGWKLAAQPEDYAERVARADGRGWMVRVHASGKHSLALLEQTLNMAPGRWLITMKARDGGLAKPERLTLRLECSAIGAAAPKAGGQANVQPSGVPTLPPLPLVERSLGSVTANDTDISLTATVPEGCRFQHLSLTANEADGDAVSEIEVLSFAARRS
ncbi:MAG: hypothetical protein ABIR23_01795 [Novosphingobium sp.]